MLINSIKWLSQNTVASGSIIVLIDMAYRGLLKATKEERDSILFDAVVFSIENKIITLANFASICAGISYARIKEDGYLTGFSLDQSHFLSEFIQRYDNYIKEDERKTAVKSECVSIW